MCKSFHEESLRLPFGGIRGGRRLLRKVRKTYFFFSLAGRQGRRRRKRCVGGGGTQTIVFSFCEKQVEWSLFFFLNASTSNFSGRKQSQGKTTQKHEAIRAHMSNVRTPTEAAAALCAACFCYSEWNKAPLFPREAAGRNRGP